MSDTSRTPGSEQANDNEQDGAVENTDDPQAEGDVTSGGAPEDPDTPEHVYSGDTD